MTAFIHTSLVFLLGSPQFASALSFLNLLPICMQNLNSLVYLFIYLFTYYLGLEVQTSSVNRKGKFDLCVCLSSSLSLSVYICPSESLCLPLFLSFLVSVSVPLSLSASPCSPEAGDGTS